MKNLIKLSIVAIAAVVAVSAQASAYGYAYAYTSFNITAADPDIAGYTYGASGGLNIYALSGNISGYINSYYDNYSYVGAEGYAVANQPGILNFDSTVSNLYYFENTNQREVESFSFDVVTLAYTSAGATSAISDVGEGYADSYLYSYNLGYIQSSASISYASNFLYGAYSDDDYFGNVDGGSVLVAGPGSVSATGYLSQSWTYYLAPGSSDYLVINAYEYSYASSTAPAPAALLSFAFGALATRRRRKA